MLWQLSAAYHCSILLLVSGCIRNAIRSLVSLLIQFLHFCCKTSLKSPATRGFSGKLTPARCCISPLKDASFKLPKLPALRAEVAAAAARATPCLYPALRRHKLHIPRFRSKGGKWSLRRSSSPTEPASLGFGGNPIVPANSSESGSNSSLSPRERLGLCFFPERRTQGVLAALGVGLFEELLPHDSGRQPPPPAGAAAHRMLRVHLG